MCVYVWKLVGRPLGVKGTQPMTKKTKLTALDIVAALHKRFPAPEYVAFQEVANGTGANARRWIDVLVMAIWPSRGLQVIGIEIKVSKADWKRELADPRKADAIGKYCDQWWIAAPPSIVDPETLPLNWGLMELGPRGFKTIKKAPKLKPEPLNKGFVASILRSAQENQEKVFDAGSTHRPSKMARR